MNELTNEINSGLAARGIAWATAKPWTKKISETETRSRIYVSVGGANDGYVEIAEDGALSIPRKGNGSIFGRPALARAMADIVAGLMVERSAGLLASEGK